MKGLDEIIEEFKNSEESKALDKVNEATKKLLSRKEVMEAMAEVTAEAIEASFEEKNKSAAMIRASLEGYRLIEKLFPEEPAENPDAEKPVEEPDAECFGGAAFRESSSRDGEVQRSLLRYTGYTVWQTFRVTRPDQRCGTARRIRRLEGGEGL